MALVDLAATQTDNLLDTSQLEDLIKDDLLYRDRLLKRLKDEVLDLEDLDGSVSLTDFSLDEFRLGLLRYLEANRAELSHYDGLLRKALASIELTFQRRAAANLLSSRNAVLPSSAEAPTKDGADFDLVTWLVILSPEGNG